MHDKGSSLLIPHAKADIRDDGVYGLICPACGQFCSGRDSTQEMQEDALTKGASQAYADHYMSMKGAGK
jgi:hypothetical protein